MIDALHTKNIAFLGGGNICKSFLELLANEIFTDLQVNILGVADVNDNAEGFVYARSQGFSCLTTMRICLN